MKLECVNANSAELLVVTGKETNKWKLGQIKVFANRQWRVVAKNLSFPKATLQAI
jgi:hypothetical protein